MNTLLNNLEQMDNFKTTENGATSFKSTLNAVYDLFALGGAYRKRSDEDCILLFKNAFEEDETLALKCLFYLRDARGGQGERRFFRLCFHWLAQKHSEAAARNMANVSEYGRYDDLWYTLMDTPLENDMLAFVKHQLALDMECKTPSLLAKWLPSENASSATTKNLGNRIRQYLGMTHKQYRKTLSILRERINVLERLMSANKWNEIEFDKIPSRAGLIYKNAFARRDIIAKKYETFAKDTSTKVNADVLYPYEIVAKAVGNPCYAGFWGNYAFPTMTSTDRAMIEKYWNNQKDYLDGKPCKMMCVVDTSGSMTGSEAAAPINVAISLGMYCAERLGGPFKNRYVSFSRNPQLIKIEGVDFVDKVRRIYQTNECSNTDLVKTFRLLKKASKLSAVEDRLDTVVVISDMEIDHGSYFYSKDAALTEMQKMREEWEAEGLKFPNVVYWNVDARQNTFLDKGPGVTFVSGMSPSIFEQVLTGKSGWDLCLEKLMSKRYEAVK